MANSSKRRTSSSNSSKKNTGKRSTSRKPSAAEYRKESEMFHEIGLIVLFVLMVIVFLCNFGIIGPIGNTISGILFGLFGLPAYVVPVVLFVAVTFWYANTGNRHAVRKLISGVILFFMIGVICDLFAQNASNLQEYDLKTIYTNCQTNRNGGGVISGSLTYFLYKYLEFVGTILVVVLCAAVSFILMTEKSLLTGVKDGGSRMLEKGREDSERRKEYAEQRRLQNEENRIKKDEERARREEERRIREEERKVKEEERQNEKRLIAEEKEAEKILRMDKKVTGVVMDTTIPKKENVRRRDDIHEIMYNEEDVLPVTQEAALKEEFDFDKIRIRSAHQLSIQEVEEEQEVSFEPKQKVSDADHIRIHSENTPKPVLTSTTPLPTPTEERKRPVARPAQESGANKSVSENGLIKEIEKTEKKPPQKYIFPPLSRLQKGSASAGDNTQELKETAMRLQQTLNTFGVKVTITDISQGPSVTRYEMQPEQGVKVSKIVGLSDDIKLNLAATDIRIEAPIPGKAAIGIEVPNKENMAVALRDLFETKEFKEFPSNIAFAVGKDIAGQVVVADIAKMPHMLIAGATGSGKSVCINTLIMSILYKAHPDDVKLIMVDPKVVELSVYNGIPHLLIPVVTDPKKASAALHWAVSEMTERYKKFADFNVRDLKGYNKKLETMLENGEEDVPAKMPQIVIIVDELADLMMVAPGEVEEAICRLAQLARACGIHLIIATQRPSVDVITGLIKANMPSRVAFSVSSGVDSRTILDMNGAEKLLGKGDMLFYPQGYAKPARIQGAFVSDKEVSDVVDFLKNQAIGNTYAEDVETQIKNIGNSAGSGASAGGTSGGNGLDDYFADAGRFIIEKDKASIGMLQRAFKIGFNRAARIMDQLCDYGVVGEEVGTKPRNVLMSMEQFEQLLEEVI